MQNQLEQEEAASFRFIQRFVMTGVCLISIKTLLTCVIPVLGLPIYTNWWMSAIILLTIILSIVWRWNDTTVSAGRQAAKASALHADTRRFDSYPADLKSPIAKPFVVEGYLLEDGIEDQGTTLTTIWGEEEFRTVSDPEMDDESSTSGMGIGVTGWDEKSPHSFSRIREFLGKKVRVTLEILHD